MVGAACSSSAPAHSGHVGSTDGVDHVAAAPQGPAAETRQENTRPGSRWQISRPAALSELAGFTDRTDVLPGEPVRLFVSTSQPSFTVTGFRMGWYGGAGGRAVWASGRLPHLRQPAPTTSSLGTVSAAAWRPSITLPTQSWPAGDYLLRLDAPDQRSSFVPLTVRSASTRGRLVLLNAVTTWQAYNHFGGYSLYSGPSRSYESRARVVSFDRPYDFGQGAADFVGNERPMVELAERLGLPLAYATSLDLAADPSLLDGALGVLSLGHDEYWSPAMRAEVTAARDRGTSLAFFGANAVYRRIRLSPGPLGPNRTEINYKDGYADPLARSDPAISTGNWPSPPAADPESTLTGEPYRCNPVSAAMVFTGADGWLLAGSGLHAGSRLAGQVGSEYDGLGAPHPRPIDLLAHSPLRCRGRSDSSDASWYTTRSGAGVFDAGTSAWVCAIDDQCAPGAGGPSARKAITAISTNLLRAMALGRPGAAHPATGAGVPPGYGTGTTAPPGLDTH
jgi:hypothetical protein